jgi:hypothetical protein
VTARTTLFPLLFLILLALTGCRSTRPIEGSSPYRFVALNAEGSRQTAVVSLADGRQERARALRVAPDSTSWIDPGTRSVRSVATADVAAVRFTDRSRGALQGGAAAMALGAVAGLAIGLSRPSCPYDTVEDAVFCGITELVAPKEALALALALTGGLGGGVAGAVLGAAVGSQRTYRIVQPPAPASALTSAGGRDPE